MAYEGIYIVNGPPGTGKTRFCANQVDKVCRTVERTDDEAAPVAVCSLTKAAAREIASRDLPIPDWQVGTLHSMAYRQIGQPPVAEAESKDFNEQHTNLAISGDADIDDSTGETLVENPDAPGNKLYQRYSLYRAQMIPRDQWHQDVQYFATQWEAWKQKNGFVDFSDMIDLAIIEGKGHAPGNPSVIVVDEAQDMSVQEWQLLRVWYEAADAMIVAGDPYQELYSWRGSDASVFFDPVIPNDHKKILAQSHRVPRLVRDASLRWLRENLSDYVEIDYRSRPEDGALGSFTSVISWPDQVVEYVREVLSTSQDSVMIAASCGYMLRQTIAALRSYGIPFSNRWRRKRSDWNPLRPSGTGRATHFKLLGLRDLLEQRHAATYADFNSILSMLRVDSTLKQGAKAFYKQMSSEHGKARIEMVDVQNAFQPEAWQQMTTALQGDTSGREFCAWVGQHGAAKVNNALGYVTEVVVNYGFDALLHEPRVYVGTIHSFKGAEADHVILYPDLSMAGDQAFNGGAVLDVGERDSVVRTFYVGMTRAKKTLSICSAKSRLAVNIPLDIT